MKKLTLIGCLLAALALAPAVEAGRTWTVEPLFPSVGSDALEPGSFVNPYVIRETSPGRFEMSSELPAPGRALEPGSPFNPYVIEPVNPPAGYQVPRWGR